MIVFRSKHRTIYTESQLEAGQQRNPPRPIHTSLSQRVAGLGKALMSCCISVMPSDKRVRFSTSRNVTHEIVPTRFIRTATQYIPPDKQSESIIDDGYRVDTLSDLQEKKQIGYGLEAHKIEGVWMIPAGHISNSHAACFSMLALDADPSAVIVHLLSGACDFGGTPAALSCYGLTVTEEQVPRANLERYLKYKFAHKLDTEWSALILNLQGNYPIIVSNYDSATGTLLVRDPMTSYPFTMHFDDLRQYLPDCQCASVTKLLSEEEKRDIKSIKSQLRWERSEQHFETSINSNSFKTK